MKKRKGSLIVATCLLSVVLLIILMTMFNINRKNAELISVQSDREKAYQIASRGLDKATEEIEKKIYDEYVSKNKPITWDDLYNKDKLKMEKPITVSGEEIEGNDKYYYSYSYCYKNGKITSTGTYGTSPKDNIKITLTANYILDYMGIDSSGLYYIPQNIISNDTEKSERAKIVGLNAVYSQKTQCPMTPWINNSSNSSQKYSVSTILSTSYSNGEALAIPIPKNGYFTTFDLSSNPISNYYILYDNKFDTSSDKYVKLDSSKNQVINSKKYSEIKSESSRCFITNMIKSLNIAEQSKYDNNDEKMHVYIANKDIDKNDENPVDKLPISGLKKLYLKVHLDDYYYDSIFDAVEDNLKDINVVISQIKDENEDRTKYLLPFIEQEGSDKSTGIYKFDNDYINKKLNISKNPLPKQTDTPVITSSEKKKNIYLLKGRNMIIIPVNSTVVIDGDLILAQNENMPEDNSANYPVLLVTGNLIVNGSIKGVGTVFSMNSITINALPEVDVPLKEGTNEKYKEYVKNVEKNGAVIVHACNQIYITNTYSLSSIDGDKAKNITSSWILTQDRNAIARLDSNCSYLLNSSSIASMFENSNKETPPEFLENLVLQPIGTNITLNLEDSFENLPDYVKPSGPQCPDDTHDLGRPIDVITDQGNDPRFHVRTGSQGESCSSGAGGGG